MWEFSIETKGENADLAQYLFKTLQSKVKEVSGVITSYELNSMIFIVLACPEVEKVRLKYIISNAISYGICTYFKEDFLQKYLKIPQKNNLEEFTFRKALVYFDKETDKFLVSKHLKLDKNIVLESFFYFKLAPLREKWKELVGIANENGSYLISDDSFIELLRFLIDNIEFLSDEIIVQIQNAKIRVLDTDFNDILESDNLSEFDLVEYLFKASPRKISWCSDKKLLFLEKIFAKRIDYVSLPMNPNLTNTQTQSLQNPKNVL